MGVTTFLFLMFSSIAITIPLTNFLKKILRETGTPCFTNMIVLDCSMISSTGMSMLHRWSELSHFESVHILRLLFLILCTWFFSMAIYDRAKQTSAQRTRYRLEKEEEKERAKKTDNKKKK